MKTIRTKVYKFDELSKDAQDRAIIDHINFEIEVSDENSWIAPIAEKMERNGTPWFLAETLFHEHKQTVIDTIKMNEYEFTKEGVFI